MSTNDIDEVKAFSISAWVEFHPCRMNFFSPHNAAASDAANCLQRHDSKALRQREMRRFPVCGAS
jgi:hypothetical protein